MTEREKALAAQLQEFVECAIFDPMMEGPRFKGWNRSALDRCLVKSRALLAADVSADGRPTAWMKGHVTPSSPNGPAEYDVDLVYSDDQPEGEGWLPLYRVPPAPAEGTREAVLREALKPFAKAARELDDDNPPELCVEDSASIERALHEGDQPTVGDLRRARDALSSHPPRPRQHDDEGLEHNELSSLRVAWRRHTSLRTSFDVGVDEWLTKQIDRARAANVICKQCGNSFGSGDGGDYDRCDQHDHTTIVIPEEMLLRDDTQVKRERLTLALSEARSFIGSTHSSASLDAALTALCDAASGGGV